MNKKSGKVRAAISAGFLLCFSVWLGPLAAADFKPASEIEGRLVPITGDEGIRAVDLDIRFKVNSAGLTDAARHQVAELGKAMNSKKLSGARFEINGHTDALGKVAYNKVLSLKRAQAVKDFLIKNFAVAPGRLDVHGYGEEHLKNALEPNSGENRRVEIIAHYEGQNTPPKDAQKRENFKAIQ